MIKRFIISLFKLEFSVAMLGLIVPALPLYIIYKCVMNKDFKVGQYLHNYMGYAINNIKNGISGDW